LPVARPVVFTPAAGAEVAEAQAWYEAQAPGLGARFRAEGGETVMTDTLDVAAPLGWLGAVVTRLVLAPHLRRFVAARAQALRAVAESEDWRRYVTAETATV